MFSFQPPPGLCLEQDTYRNMHVMLLQDLQAEVEAQQGVYDSLTSTGSQLVPTMGAPDAQKLQSRLEEMNRRWLHLMTKSMEIRLVVALIGCSFGVHSINSH